MTYPGGKGGSGTYQKIINQMPPHQVYIEPFLGAGFVIRHKKPARSNIGIDLDDDMVVFVNMSLRNRKYNLFCMDGIKWLRDNKPFSDDTLIYCDPPYLIHTRKTRGKIYEHELTVEQHRELLKILDGLTCMVMISGYYSLIYEQHLKDWRMITFNSQTRGGRTATECLWMNYPPPLELHDYQYLGDDYRERERIKRKQKRWKNKLLKMPTLERMAILSAIDEIRHNQ